MKIECIDGVNRVKIVNHLRPVLNRPIEQIRAALSDNKRIDSYTFSVPAMTFKISRRDDGKFNIEIERT